VIELRDQLEEPASGISIKRDILDLNGIADLADLPGRRQYRP